MNILVSHESFSDQAAYNIVETIYERRDELIAVRREAQNLRLDLQKQIPSPVPFHRAH